MEMKTQELTIISDVVSVEYKKPPTQAASECIVKVEVCPVDVLHDLELETKDLLDTVSVDDAISYYGEGSVLDQIGELKVREYFGLNYKEE